VPYVSPARKGWIGASQNLHCFCLRFPSQRNLRAVPGSGWAPGPNPSARTLAPLRTGAHPNIVFEDGAPAIYPDRRSRSCRDPVGSPASFFGVRQPCCCFSPPRAARHVVPTPLVVRSHSHHCHLRRLHPGCLCGIERSETSSSPSAFCEEKSLFSMLVIPSGARDLLLLLLATPPRHSERSLRSEESLFLFISSLAIRHSSVCVARRI
jgi:hypothetical protein